MSVDRYQPLWKDAASGLRTRYAPKSRINPGLVALAPWLSLMVIFYMFLAFEGRMVLAPGVQVQLPEAPFRGGTPGVMVAVVLCVEGPGGSAPSQLVFFDDVRFRFDQPEDREGFRERLAAARRVHRDVPLIIEADARVPHGTIMELSRIAEEAGVTRVNLATRPQ